MAKVKEYGADEAIQPITQEQPLSKEEKGLVTEAYTRLDIFREGCREMHNRAKEARRIALLDDPNQDPKGTPPDQRTLQLQTLKSTLNNSIADQMDNMPEARMVPERPGLREVADDLSDIVRCILDMNDFEAYYSRRVEDFFVTGTAVTQIGWDGEMDGGAGNVTVLRWPLEGFLWDPVAADIQDGRACIKVSWHPLSWYASHFPEEAPYVRAETYAANELGVPDAWAQENGQDEKRAMLMEYWYRKYDAASKRYNVHVAYIAGRALLYLSEKESPDGIYSHGEYPFVLDTFGSIEGLPVGHGMVHELAPMMRYINRYANYIDLNMRLASKVKLLVNRNSGIDNSALTDMNTVVVEGNSIDPNAMRPYETKQFNGAAMSAMIQMQVDMKQDSGQNQFTRGETAGGVNAASAIAMLQEAGGKIGRMRTNDLNNGFRAMVRQIIWLVSQFYTEKRAYMVTGRNNSQHPVSIDQERIYNGDAPKADQGETPRAGGDSSAIMPPRKVKLKGKGVLPPPPYTVRVMVQRRNPLQNQANNEMLIQMYGMFAQMSGNPQMQAALPLSSLVEMLDVGNKDEIMPLLKLAEQKNDVMLQQAQVLAGQQRKIAEQEQAIANLAEALQQAQGQAPAGSLAGVR